ncbi:hypothetical protein WQ54_21415 [Bacillus sp. SA1-12]|uniref:FixH family protein n=1 Tax=Bacillus sp. SA1-12 TaxID=1455638 RepID=UPI00062732B0|nr:FixH family protein [Bacillus sp. SA1-12]KKI90506.1 hypothetical protein WQ54_21415 [Bacillus sp. SA1-12]
MRFLILLIGCLLILGGCTAKEEAKTSKTIGLDVAVTSIPKQIQLLKPVKITALVTINGAEVNEKAEVEFELIKKNGAQIGFVTPEYIGDGKYQIETIFDEEGEYQIVSHVSIGNVHEMPIFEIKVLP